MIPPFNPALGHSLDYPGTNEQQFMPMKPNEEARSINSRYYNSDGKDISTRGECYGNQQIHTGAFGNRVVADHNRGGGFALFG